MTLLELCEPLFNSVCWVSRSRAMTGSQYAVVRSDIKTILSNLEETAASDARLSSQYKKVFLPLIFFVDEMIINGNLNFSAEWQSQPLGYDYKEGAGDQKFFELLDDTLADKSEEATERLAVYYTCLGLGFTGWHTGQPEQLRRMMNEIYDRIRPLVETDPTAKLCKEAYENVNTDDLREPPSSRWLIIAAVFIFFTLGVFVFYYFTFHYAADVLSDSLNIIAKHGETPPTQGAK